MSFIDATIKAVYKVAYKYARRIQMQQLKQFIKWHTNMQEEFKLKKGMQCFEFLEQLGRKQIMPRAQCGNVTE